MLRNHLEIPANKIAEKYNVNEATINRISLGQTYFNPDLSYPLRSSHNREFLKKNTLEDYFNSE